MSKVFERKMSEVVDRLTQAGFTEVFTGESGGIRGTKSNMLHTPQELEIIRIERFEGISNPEDETMVLALHCKTHDCRGTYITPYGKDMPSVDATLIRKIPDARKQ
ncbi:MAG: hypothetical protein JO332_18875 [Planctomycetaceae bacterium]|nr:hypothetical protein [Planctomycetaceae bacterium]